MREVILIGFAVFIGVAGAVITALPMIAWFRRRRSRGAILRAFMHAADDRQLRAMKFRREKEIFGDGFIDSLTGTAGTLRFRLVRRFRPFQRIDPYWLHLEGETFAYELETSEQQRHLIVSSYLILRWQLPRDVPDREAS